MDIDADLLIQRLRLSPHPEGGHYRETFRASSPGGARAPGAAILFLLKAGEASRWHRTDAAELWLHHLGAPLELRMVLEGRERQVRLGSDLLADDQPQGLVPPGAWQSARPLGAFCLVSCATSPAFLFETFELAPPGWSPL